ncbi:MAG: phosphoenolpyruvate--protein phosphotransferase [Gammaproteobacteria bacterium]
MLNTLRHIIQEVNAAESLPEALDIVVKGVNEAIGTEACSVFLVDVERGENVLVATEGLNKDLIGKIRLKLGEGLVGLVSERAEPINLENASLHPKYVHVSGLGEEALTAFLGVPIIHQRQVLGVLVVYQRANRCFDESEEAFLITLSAQLAGAIAYSVAVGAVKDFNRSQGRVVRDNILSGLPAAPGVAIGRAVVVYPLADLAAVPDRKIEIDEIDAEIELFQQALTAARENIRHLSKNMEASGLPDEERALFDAYAKMLNSETLIREIEEEIRAGRWAQGALKHVTEKHIARFENMNDPYLKERATDLRDLAERILSHLQSREGRAPNFPEKTILVGEEVTPAALAEVPEGRLVGLVSVRGSINSHVAILARALGIPTVLNVEGVKISHLEDEELIVDGYYGQVYRSPSRTVKHEFITLMEEEQELDRQLDKLRDLPAETLDNHTVELYVNTGLAPDIGKALNVGAQGVGLYRTEVPFMSRDRFPSEEEQRVIYHQLLRAFAPRPVIMRTLDVGGDKALPYFPVQEDNPFLGWRGIRITLDHPEILLVQMRAMLQASEGLDNLQIMFPMITTVPETEEALRLLKQAYEEIVTEGFAVKMPKIGVMLEVPSAVYQAQLLAKRVDFVSVGSNDLTQYLLAVDRNNARVAALYDSLHPAVLRALMQAVAGVHREGKEISICGEMAGDPAAVVLLMAMGFDSMSMNATRFSRVKWVIRKFTLKRARQLLEEVLMMDDAIEIRNHMESALEEEGLGGLMRAGK